MTHEFISITDGGADFIHTTDFELAIDACINYTCRNQIRTIIKQGDRPIWEIVPTGGKNCDIKRIID